MSGGPETATATQAAEIIEVWAIVELMGHVRYGGRLTEEQHFGTTLGRVDVPQHDGGFATHFFGGSSIYQVTPCSEETARKVASFSWPRPVHQAELPSGADPDDAAFDDDEEDPF